MGRLLNTAFGGELLELNMMSIATLQEGQRKMKEWLELVTDKPKFLLANEGNEGGHQTVQRLITPLLDMPNVVVILTTNQTGPNLPFHDRFEDRLLKHMEFVMTDTLREEIVDRKIAAVTSRYNLICPGTVRFQLIEKAKTSIRDMEDLVDVSGYRSHKDGHSHLWAYNI